MAAKRKKTKKKDVDNDFWSSLPNSRKHLFCLAFLFIIPVFLYTASIFGGQQYLGNDVIQWRAGAESLIEYQEESDEVAHWATNMFSGMPATTISHPPQISNLDNTILKALRFIYPVAEMWILLGGAYMMFLLMGIRSIPAVFGALIIGFTTYIPIIIGAGHNAKFLAYIYIPWLYAGYLMCTRSQKNKWLALFVFTLALTLHLRSYHPQVTYFFLFPLLTLFFYDLVRAVQSNRTKPFLFDITWLVSGAVIAILIVAQLYWSTLEYSSFSMRGGSEIAQAPGLAREYAFAWSQGWSELLTLLIPGVFGGSELYWGPKSFTSGPHYFGALAFLFFVIGVLKSNHSLKWVFLGPGIATLLFSLGENFSLLNNLMFDYFPLFDKFRVPEMWLMISAFCFSVPAVLGFQWILDSIENHKKKKDWQKPIYVVLALAVVIAFSGFQMLNYERPGERQMIANQIASQNNVSPDDSRVSQTVNRVLESQLKPDRRELANADTTRFIILIAIGVAIIFGMAMGKLSVSVGSILVVILLAYDLIQVDKRYISERSLADGQLSREQVIERNGRDLDQFIQQHIDHNKGWPYRVLPLLDDAFQNAIPSYFYPSAGGYSGAKLSYYQDLINEAFFTGPSGINTGILSMLNIRYITLQQPMPLSGFEQVYSGNSGVVLENTTVLPKAFFVDSVEVKEQQSDVLQSISNTFNPSDVAFVADPLITNIETDPTSSAKITGYSANQIEIEVSRSSPGFLVLSEIWYPPGWKATLNGEEIPIIRTNYVLRGFEIPAGNHTLEMIIEPVWYATGRWMSIVGTLLLTIIGVIAITTFIRYRD